MALKKASTFLGVCATVGLALAGSWLFAATPASTQSSRVATGQILASTCAGCHGQDGNSYGPATPSIAGISVPYFIGTMEQYREGRRNSTIMNRVALGYTSEEVQAMAYFFAAQQFEPVKQRFDAARAARGAIVHKRYCEHCHRNGGAESGRAGILAGQWLPYLRATLTDMVIGKREMPRSMKRWMDRLVRIEGEESVEDLMHYYASNTVGTTSAQQSLQSLFPAR